MQKTKLKQKTPLKAKTNLKKGGRIKAKKPKVAGVSQLKKEADMWFSTYVLYRDGEYRSDGWYSQCITCEKWVKLLYKKDGTIDRRKIHWGHFQSSRHNITRYHPENVHAQCQACNIHNQGEQFRYAQAIDRLYGEGRAKELQVLAKELHPFDKEELLSVITDCKTYIDHCLSHVDNYRGVDTD